MTLELSRSIVRSTTLEARDSMRQIAALYTWGKERPVTQDLIASSSTIGRSLNLPFNYPECWLRVSFLFWTVLSIHFPSVITT